MVYQFIHIPKTGGLSVEKFVVENKLYDIIKTDTDKELKVTEIDKDEKVTFRIHHHYKCKDFDNPIIIIRHPESRFHSLYHQWKKIENNKSKNVKNFIEALKNNDYDKKSHIFWHAHLKTQYHWIKGCNYKKLTIIRYNNDIIKKLIKVLNITSLNDNVKINKSSYDKLETLNKKDITFIRKYYKDDYDFFREVNKNPSKFKAIY